MTIEKPTDECADEVLQGEWPDYDEDLFKQAADFHFQLARTVENDVARSPHALRQYATQEMEGKAAAAIDQKMGTHLAGCTEDTTAHANVAGFLLMGQAAIMGAKSAMKSAVSAHGPAHLMPKVVIGGQGVKDADMQKAQALVTTAKQQLETASLQSRPASNLMDSPLPQVAPPKSLSGHLPLKKEITAVRQLVFRLSPPWAIRTAPRTPTPA
ncbi:Uncharacterised protein [Mycobacteroides abscessus subsp. abscessus]|uniref:hypothetical protein n=1 Tax=Mycobacteroides abscessus TaxID=36809 RepID=UPI00092651C2|nr:hypothetical protein [Mycobacteroides abscessus]SIC17475.1 Uncharacterised protein [Mycobacteroides abscessus subsp. abscessus]